MITAASGVAAAALSVSPSLIRLTRAASRAITIVNAGTTITTVDAETATLALDRRGRPAIARTRDPALGWLSLQPRRVVLVPGGKVVVTVSSRAPLGALPGDHPALVLLTTQPRRASGVAIRMRVGVVVFVHIAGRIVRRLDVSSLRVRRGALEIVVVNRGNVVERPRVRIVLSHPGLTPLRAGTVERMLLPHTRAALRLRRPPGVRGWVTARVEAGSVRRTFRLRL
jgi:hypothetical protein